MLATTVSTHTYSIGKAMIPAPGPGLPVGEKNLAISISRTNATGPLTTLAPIASAALQGNRIRRGNTNAATAAKNGKKVAKTNTTVSAKASRPPKTSDDVIAQHWPARHRIAMPAFGPRNAGIERLDPYFNAASGGAMSLLGGPTITPSADCPPSAAFARPCRIEVYWVIRSTLHRLGGRTCFVQRF